MSIRGDAEATSPWRLRLAQGLRLRPSKGVWRTSSWCVSGEPARLVEECLVPLLRVWDSPDESDFASLPSRLETKLQVASRLGKGLACVRVDFYEARGRVCCGEITFTDADDCLILLPPRDGMLSELEFY